jgi:hypothetical protein
MNNVPSTPGGLHSSNSPRPAPADEVGLEPIGLVDEPGAVSDTAKKIKAFGMAAQQKSHDWKRAPTTPGTGAVRVRSFHGRLSDQGLGFMDDQINEWLDSHPEVEVKFVTSSVGTYEGKIREPALVLNLWY